MVVHTVDCHNMQLNIFEGLCEVPAIECTCTWDQWDLSY